MLGLHQEASCDTLYSDDMQDGQRIAGVTIRTRFERAMNEFREALGLLRASVSEIGVDDEGLVLDLGRLSGSSDEHETGLIRRIPADTGWLCG
jgi:hypothetical protein